MLIFNNEKLPYANEYGPMYLSFININLRFRPGKSCTEMSVLPFKRTLLTNYIQVINHSNVTV